MRTSLTIEDGVPDGRGSVDGWEATSDNKQVAPTPRVARLRGTPAPACGPWEAVSGRIDRVVLRRGVRTRRRRNFRTLCHIGWSD